MGFHAREGMTRQPNCEQPWNPSVPPTTKGMISSSTRQLPSEAPAGVRPSQQPHTPFPDSGISTLWWNRAARGFPGDVTHTV